MMSKRKLSLSVRGLLGEVKRASLSEGRILSDNRASLVL
jgi:hypothetical protein